MNADMCFGTEPHLWSCLGDFSVAGVPHLASMEMGVMSLTVLLVHQRFLAEDKGCGAWARL
jgi:hypothetical protein